MTDLANPVDGGDEIRQRRSPSIVAVEIASSITSIKVLRCGIMAQAPQGRPRNFIAWASYEGGGVWHISCKSSGWGTIHSWRNLMPEGDDLAISLFFLSLAIPAFGLEAMKAETIPRRITFAILAIACLLAALFWLQLKLIWPPFAATMASISLIR
jgi:hypothetical protein